MQIGLCRSRSGPVMNGHRWSGCVLVALSEVGQCCAGTPGSCDDDPSVPLSVLRQPLVECPDGVPRWAPSGAGEEGAKGGNQRSICAE